MFQIIKKIIVLMVYLPCHLLRFTIDDIKRKRLSKLYDDDVRFAAEKGFYDVQLTKQYHLLTGDIPLIREIGEDIELVLWHGGYKHFVEICLDYHGTGEGDAHGYGFYTAETESGARYYANYMAKVNNDCYIYKIKARLKVGEIWDIEAYESELIFENGEKLSFNDYKSLSSCGKKYYAEKLKNKGIKAIQTVGEKPTHGYTYVFIDVTVLSIQETFKRKLDSSSCVWEAL